VFGFSPPGVVQETDSLSALAIQPDGKIVAAGTGGTRIKVVRLLSNGTLDPAFGTNGEVVGSQADETGAGLALQGDGKILVVGSFSSDSAPNIDSVLTRYNPDGSLDTSFNGTGQAFGLREMQWSSVAVRPDGLILAGGSVAATNQLVLVGYDAAGQAQFTTTALRESGWNATHLAVQPDGNVVLTGSLGGLMPLSQSASAAGAVARFIITDQSPIIAVGADAGGGPEVKVYDATTGALKFDFLAYAANFTGGVRVAVGDVNGDGVPDLITAPGPGGGPDIHVYDGRTGQLLREFFTFDPAFTGGVFVAAGDVNGDAYSDIICGADAGGGPQVRVFSGKDGSLLDSFFAFDPRFTGGVRVAAEDVNGDGHADIIAGAGPGGGPSVAIYSGSDGSLLHSFFAFDSGFTGGVWVAAGGTDTNGTAEIVAGAGSGGGPDVNLFRADGTLLNSFLAYAPGFSGGVRVGSVGQADGTAEILTAAGAGGGPEVRGLDGQSLAPLDDFFALNPQFTGGLYVAGGPSPN
jgi:uncharacterized delta-60 repeat protein